MEDPFVTPVDSASLHYFGDAPLHAEPSRFVQLPSSPTSHQYLRTVKNFDRTKIFRAASSTLNATATPFKPKMTSPDDQPESRNNRNVAYPLMREAFVGGPNEQLQQLGKMSQEHRLHIEAFHVKAVTPVELRHHRGGDGQAIGWQPPPRLLTTQYTNQMYSGDVRVTNQNRLSPGRDRREMVYSDGPSRHRRLVIPRGSSYSCPSLRSVVRAGEASPGYRQFALSASRENSPPLRPPLSYSYPPSSVSMPELPNQQPKVSYPSYSAHTHHKKNGVLNCMDQGSFQADQNGDSQSTIFDHYTPTPTNQPPSQTQINPYTQDGSTMGSGAYFPGSTNYPQQASRYMLPKCHLALADILVSFNTIFTLHYLLIANSVS